MVGQETVPSFPSGIAEKMGFKNPFTASVGTVGGRKIFPQRLSGKTSATHLKISATLKNWWLEVIYFPIGKGKLFRGELVNFRGGRGKNGHNVMISRSMVVCERWTWFPEFARVPSFPWRGVGSAFTDTAKKARGLFVQLRSGHWHVDENSRKPRVFWQLCPVQGEKNMHSRLHLHPWESNMKPKNPPIEREIIFQTSSKPPFWGSKCKFSKVYASMDLQ